MALNWRYMFTVRSQHVLHQHFVPLLALVFLDVIHDDSSFIRARSSDNDCRFLGLSGLRVRIGRLPGGAVARQHAGFRAIVGPGS